MDRNEQRRRNWNRHVVGLVQRLDINLQNAYEHELAHGDLRNFLHDMRESGRSSAEAVEAWVQIMVHAR